MVDLFGSPSKPAAVAVSEEINHLKGKKVDLLTKPSGPIRLLYLECEKGDYRVRVGNIPAIDMPGDTPPAGEVSDGSGSLSLTEGQIRIIPAPDEVTVSGLSNSSVLTFYYNLHLLMILICTDHQYLRAVS